MNVYLINGITFQNFIYRQERDLMTRTDRFGVEVRERVMWDIREGVVGADTFIPKHVVFLTWKNMSFAGGIDISLYKVILLIIFDGFTLPNLNINVVISFSRNLIVICGIIIKYGR